MPFARSRAILLFLATKAVDDGPTFAGHLTDIAAMFQLPWSLGNIADHFLHVAQAEYACSVNACACSPLPCRREHQVAYSVRYHRDTHRFELTLSDEFHLSAQLGIRCPLRQLRELILARQMAALDLLIWYRWQEHQQLAASMDPLSAHGPFQRIKSNATPTCRRDEIVRLHREVTRVWTDCPYSVTPNGHQLTYEPRERKPTTETGCLFDISFE